METNNKLIAEFMGYEFTETPTCGILIGNKFTRLPKKDNKPPFEVQYGWNYPNYHKDWNLLIGVLKKIREISNTKLTIDDYDKMKSITKYLNPYDYEIDFIYEKVIEFIKWYNNEKS